VRAGKIRREVRLPQWEVARAGLSAETGSAR
jgi:hypothetical protein